jgi:hypothetical protein
MAARRIAFAEDLLQIAQQQCLDDVRHCSAPVQRECEAADRE